MVESGRRSARMRPIAVVAPMASMVLVALTLAISSQCRAQGSDGAAAATQADAVSPGPATPAAPAAGADAKPEATDADAPRARVPRQQTHRTVGQGIDETVRRLTRGLELDPGQQAKLRDILLDQQRQVRKLRSENSGRAVDWAGETAAIVDQAKVRIRAMLNDEQRKKYSTDVPREMTAPAHADLQHWMQIQETQRQQADKDSK
jgi:hypothetical protein